MEPAKEPHEAREPRVGHPCPRATDQRLQTKVEIRSQPHLKVCYHGVHELLAEGRVGLEGAAGGTEAEERPADGIRRVTLLTPLV